MAQPFGIPAHTGILAQPKNIATGRVEQEFWIERQRAGRARGVGLDLIDGRVWRINGNAMRRGGSHRMSSPD